jgi:hypothetical protein
MTTVRPHLTHLFMEVGDLSRAREFWLEAIGPAGSSTGAGVSIAGEGSLDRNSR